MPNDTLWLNEVGDFVVLDSGTEITAENIALILNNVSKDKDTYYAYNSKNNDSNNAKIRLLQKAEKKQKEAQFEKDKLFYDDLGSYFEILLMIGFFAVIIYFIRKANWKRNNPFEDDSDWIELGSGPFIDASEEEVEHYRRLQKQKKLYPPTLVYHGRQLNFNSKELSIVLTKRFPFYNTLSTEKKVIFTQRLQKFIKTKDFKIHDRKGFKEMPILLSATAIQVSFGLEDYLLLHYKNIHVFPSEFLGLEPSIRFLVGNVSKNNINISWKHFLEGFENNNDGHNVGLHEMAHAYYCQNVLYIENETNFSSKFYDFKLEALNVMELEKNAKTKLYSDNGVSNQDEFWAESVELFFEKTFILKETYPYLFTKISTLLNQELTNNPAQIIAL